MARNGRNPHKMGASRISTRHEAAEMMRPSEPPHERSRYAGGGASSSRARLALGLETFVEIGADRLHQRVDLAVEEMVGACDYLLLDHDALLGLELVDEPGDVLVRHDRILVAVNDHAGGRARREERKV